MEERSSAYLFFGSSEETVNIVCGLPNSWHTVVIVSEAFFKGELELDEHVGIRSVLIHFAAKCQPASFSNSSQCLLDLFVCAVEA